MEVLPLFLTKKTPTLSLALPPGKMTIMPFLIRARTNLMNVRRQPFNLASQWGSTNFTPSNSCLLLNIRSIEFSKKICIQAGITSSKKGAPSTVSGKLTPAADENLAMFAPAALSS